MEALQGYESDCSQRGACVRTARWARIFSLPTTVYIAIPVRPETRAHIISCIFQLQKLQPSLQPLAGFSHQDGTEEEDHPPHISLSRTVYTTAQQRQTLLSGLQRQFKRQKRFKLSMGGWEVFMNDQNNTGFLAVGISAGSEQLCEMIEQVDTALHLHGLEKFYEPARPHMSVAFLPGAEAAEQLEGSLRPARLMNSSPRFVQEVTQLVEANFPHDNLNGARRKCS
ncbi:hypothetical protein WJX84_001148 [Apatococcus fuscideae]|uniref:U6 snRNA phosphodiesterase 1 n=1 Tax=Apatococcus fuscideae TaxID=2026836 RepID=A0AAW1TDK3_9CHLO